MGPSLCALCLRKFNDTDNKVSIMLTGFCCDCKVAVERWEDEGGR